MIGALGRRLDGQLGLAKLGRKEFLRKIFPDHWSFMVGEIALYSFLVLVVTGIYLVFFFRPSNAPVVYHGSYAPLDGIRTSEAYASTVSISFDVRAGLLARQTHHWAAVVFIAAILLHMARVFFTGAYRHPRILNWLIGVTLLYLAVFSGFTGYSMVDDLLSGTGLVIGYSVLLSLPVVGSWWSFFLFAGQVPNDAVIPRFYAIHIFILPALIAGLLVAHLLILWRQKHTNYPGPRRSDTTIVGTRLWPSYAAKAFGFMLMVWGVLVGLGAFVEINPVWLYGPFEVGSQTTNAQPDWYMGWLEGTLRMFPGWNVRGFGFLVPNVFFAGALIAILILAALYVWPFLDAWITGDHEVHHVLQRPRDHPVRTGLGAAAIAFFLMTLGAGSDDVLATYFGGNVATVRDVFRGLSLGVPAATWVLTWLVARWLRDRDRDRPERPGGPVLSVRATDTDG